MGNVGIGCFRVPPFYAAQKALEFQHDSSTPKPAHSGDKEALELIQSGTVNNTFL
jgi:hypothetical protein